MGRFEAMFRRMHEAWTKPVNGYDLMVILIGTRVMAWVDRLRIHNDMKATFGRTDES